MRPSKTNKKRPGQRFAGQRSRNGPRSAPVERNINRIPRAPKITIPQNQLVRLSYTHILPLAPASAGTTAHWETNSIVDPYATGGTQPGVSGLAGFAIMYGYYRVLAYRGTLEVINTGSSTVTLALNHSNTDISAASTTAQLAYTSTGDGQSYLLAGASSGSACKHVFRFSRSCAAIVGKESYFTDDNYAGVCGVNLTPSSPADTTHLTLMSLASTGNVTVSFRLVMEMTVELYNRTPQAS